MEDFNNSKALVLSRDIGYYGKIKLNTFVVIPNNPIVKNKNGVYSIQTPLTNIIIKMWPSNGYNGRYNRTFTITERGYGEFLEFIKKAESWFYGNDQVWYKNAGDPRIFVSDEYKDVFAFAYEVRYKKSDNQPEKLNKKIFAKPSVYRSIIGTEMPGITITISDRTNTDETYEITNDSINGSNPALDGYTIISQADFLFIADAIKQFNFSQEAMNCLTMFQMYQGKLNFSPSDAQSYHPYDKFKERSVNTTNNEANFGFKRKEN